MPERPPVWKFDSPPNEGTLTVQAILDGDPIVFVSHDADDASWQFLDGREPRTENGRIICLADMLAKDPSLELLADLPLGWIAWRDTSRSEWKRAGRTPDAVARAGRSGIDPLRRPAGERLPALDRDLRVARVELHRVAAPAGLLGGDERGA